MRNLSLRMKIATTVILIAIVSIPVSLILFKPNLPGSLPQAALPFVLGLKVAEGLALGTGIAFLIFGYPLLKRAGRSRTLTWAAYLATAWYLVNWWPHDNLHLVAGIGNLWGILGIEYAFHVTLMFAAGVLATFYYRVAVSPHPDKGHLRDAERISFQVGLKPPGEP
jgi:hypothetical protein